MRRLHHVLLWTASAGLFAALAAAVACLPGGWGLRAAVFWQQPFFAPAQQTAAWAEAVLPAPTPAPPAPTAAPTPTPTPAPTPTPPPALAEVENPGTITAEKLGHGRGTGHIPLAAGTVRNATDLPDRELAAAAENGEGRLPFDVVPNSSEPQVLILHAHATESYQLWQAPYFDPAYSARSQNTLLNVCAVGEAMAEVLNAAGINTLHDATLHDSPSYTESYARSAATARAYLEKYPSIKIILDVHRDALGTDTTRLKPLCQIDGEDTAQVMIIAGCDNGTTVKLPDWRLNLRFAAAWEAGMESAYPGLTRPVLCGYRFYNQDITTGSLLIEIGGHANTLPEALRAGTYAARALADLLTG